MLSYLLTFTGGVITGITLSGIAVVVFILKNEKINLFPPLG